MLELSQFAVPFVTGLVAFLSYSSQYLFQSLEPGPLNGREFVQFNVLVACLWICYARACFTGAGSVPVDWLAPTSGIGVKSDGSREELRKRWCRKCEIYKPPRSHHCKACKRCIPKMDHHCPWTNNCVSHFTFPHFIRFLTYAVASMMYLEYFLYLRGADLWAKRRLPSYLGPSAGQLVHLFFLFFVNSLTLFMVSITFFRAIYALGANTTTIEGWELDRHNQLLRRARVLGGYLDGPDGKKIRLKRQEFPYDIGIWQNLKQGMGGGNFILWLWPLAQTPNTPGLIFEVNGFEEPDTTWPPPDPDRVPRLQHQLDQSSAFIYPQDGAGEVEAFKARQEEDLRRRQGQDQVIRRKPFHSRFGPGAEPKQVALDVQDFEEGEEAWQDYGGNRLDDYGVDEEVEFYDEDRIPLSELIRRKGLQKAG